MTLEQKKDIARAVAWTAPGQHRLKAVHVISRLHEGMLTVRCFYKNQPAEDPDTVVFNAEEL